MEYKHPPPEAVMPLAGQPPGYEAATSGPQPIAPMPPAPTQYQYAAAPPYQQQYVAPPAGYVAGQPVVVQQPQQVVLVHQPFFGEAPAATVCPHCSKEIMTTTSYEAGALAWLICFFTAIVGLWLGCCLIPFCVPACQDVRHSCPSCKTTIYIYKRLS